jgi:hypothetical protein
MLQLGRAEAALAAFARLTELQPDSLAARQAHAIARSPPDNSMFAPQRFCRQLEGAYLQMFDRLRKGERPAPLRISTPQSA